MFVIERWGDTPGAPRICVLCEEQWTASSQEPRAFVGALYIGHICTTCETAYPDVLLKRLEGPLADVREHLQQLEAVEQWAQASSPKHRRQSLRIVSRGSRPRSDDAVTDAANQR